MNELENELRSALSRQRPPRDFAEKILARAAEPPPKPKVRLGMRWAAVAAVVVILAGGSLLYQQRVRRIEGEKARDQLLFALRLTATKLRDVQEHVTAIQSRTIELPLNERDEK